MFGKVTYFNFIPSEESLPVTIRLPKHNDRGYTLLEILVVVAIVGVVMGIATPSLLSLNKPLRDGTVQFKNQLNLIRSRAIASSQAYRIRPKYPTKAQFTGQIPNSFIVEYAANCRIEAYGPTASAILPDGWARASQLDFDLPSAVGIDGTATVAIQDIPQTPTPDPNLNWSICYDNRGITRQPVTFTLKDFQGNNRAKTATISVQQIGLATITTKDSAGTTTSTPSGEPIF
jgi:prepilin-type N-terminal cleavage/methylation domain-containing protein